MPVVPYLSISVPEHLAMKPGACMSGLRQETLVNPMRTLYTVRVAKAEKLSPDHLTVSDSPTQDLSLHAVKASDRP